MQPLPEEWRNRIEPIGPPIPVVLPEPEQEQVPIGMAAPPAMPIPGGEVEEDPERGIMGSLARAVGAGAAQTVTQTAVDVLDPLLFGQQPEVAADPSPEKPKRRPGRVPAGFEGRIQLTGMSEDQVSRRLITSMMDQQTEELETVQGWFDAEAGQYNTGVGSPDMIGLREQFFKGNKLIDIGVAPAGRRDDGEAWLDEQVEKARVIAKKDYPDTPWTESIAQDVRKGFKNAGLAKNFLVSGEGYSRDYHAGFWQMPIENMEKLALEMHRQAERRGELERSPIGKFHQKTMRAIESVLETGEYHADVSLDVYRKQSDPERKHRRELIKSMEMIRRGVDPATSDNMAFRGLLGAAEMVPVMLLGGAMGKVIGGTVAAAAGSRVGQAIGLTAALDDLAVLIPGAMGRAGAGAAGVAEALGGRAGFFAGGTLFWGSIESVDIGEGIRANGGSDELANTMAAAGGLLIGATEYLQYILLAGLYKGAKGAMNPAKDAVRKTFKSYARGLTGIYAGEVTTEMVQAVTAIGARAGAVEIGHLQGLKWPEEFEALAEELREVALAMVWIMGPGAVRKYQRHNVFNRELTEEQLKGKQTAQRIQESWDRVKEAERAREQAKRESSERGVVEETERAIQEEEARAREDENMQRAIAADEQTLLLGMGYGMAAEEVAAEKEAKLLEWNEKKSELEREEQHQAMLERERQGREAEAKAVDKDVEIAAGQVAEQVITGMQEDPDFHDAVMAFMEAEPSRKAAQAVVIPENLREQLGDTLLDSLRSREARQHFIDQFKRQRLVSEERPSPSLADVQDGDFIHFKNAKGDLETGQVLHRGPGRAWVVKTAANPNGEIIFHKDITIRRGRPGEAVAVPEVPRPVGVTEEMTLDEVKQLSVDELLEISPEATVTEVDRAYRKMARKYHPDNNANPERASAIFKMVTAAYDVASFEAQLREGANAEELLNERKTDGSFFITGPLLNDLLRHLGIKGFNNKKVEKRRKAILKRLAERETEQVVPEVVEEVAPPIPEVVEQTTGELAREQSIFGNIEKMIRDRAAKGDYDTSWIEPMLEDLGVTSMFREGRKRGDLVPAEEVAAADQAAPPVQEAEVEAPTVEQLQKRGIPMSEAKRIVEQQAVPEAEVADAEVEAPLIEAVPEVAPAVSASDAAIAVVGGAEMRTAEKAEKHNRWEDLYEAKYGRRPGKKYAGNKSADGPAGQNEGRLTNAMLQAWQDGNKDEAVRLLGLYQDMISRLKEEGSVGEVHKELTSLAGRYSGGYMVAGVNELVESESPSFGINDLVEYSRSPRGQAAMQAVEAAPAKPKKRGDRGEAVEQAPPVEAVPEVEVEAAEVEEEETPLGLYVQQKNIEGLKSLDSLIDEIAPGAVRLAESNVRRAIYDVLGIQGPTNAAQEKRREGRDTDSDYLWRIGSLRTSPPVTADLTSEKAKEKIAQAFFVNDMESQGLDWEGVMYSPDSAYSEDQKQEALDKAADRAEETLKKLGEFLPTLVMEDKAEAEFEATQKKAAPTPTPAAVTPAAAAVSMEPVSVPHQAVLDADRLQARRRGTPDLPGSRLSQNRNRLEREYSNPTDLEDRIRQQLGVMEVSNPGITAAMEEGNSQIDFDNKRLISNDGLTAVVWENTGGEVGTFTVENYAHNESGVRGLFMENAGRMTSEEYNKAYADRDDLPTHRQVVETLVGMGLAEQVMPAARRGYDDIQFTPSQASGFPLPGDVLFGKISGIVKGGVNWGKEVVKKVRTWGPHFRTRGRFTPSQYEIMEKYDGELAREFNNLKTRVDDFHNAVVETYGDIPFRNLPKETRDLHLRALSDPKLREDDLSPSVAEALGEMRDYEQILSIIMRHSDYVTDDLELTFDENHDVYLNRTYRGHDDPGWADEVRENRPELITAAEESVQRGTVEKWERVIRKSLERAVKRLARNKPDDTTRLVIADDALSTEFLDKVRAAQKWSPEKDAFEKMIAEEISSNEKLLKDVKEGRLKTEKGIRNRAIAEAKKKVSMERLGRVKEAIWLDLHREIPIDQIIEDNTVKMTPEQLRGRVEKYLTDLTVIAEQRRGQQPEKGKVNPSILMRRTLEDEAFRELYGEYKDIDLVFSRTTIKMATFIARDNFQKRMRDLGLKEGFINKEKDQVDTPYQMEGREWGALEGMWTNLEFQRALNDAFGPGVEYPGWMKLWAKGVGIAKANKTIVSPQTTERNLWGNSGFSFMWGHGGALGTAKNWMQAWSVGFYHAQPSLYKKKGVGLRGGPKVPTGWIGMRPKKSEVRKFINEALEEGILNQSLINEATELISEAWDMDFNDYDVTNQEGRKKLVAKVKRALGKFYKGAGAVYEMMDNVPKLAGYLSEKSLYRKAHPDWTEKQIRHKAGDNVKNQYPTWSRVPRFMKELRRFLPMGTFVTFHSELFRTSYRGMILAHEEFHSGNPVLRRRAIGVMVRASAITAGISALAGMIASVWHGIDDEERELLDRHQPPWSRYSTNFYYREPDGTISSYDLSFMFPHLALGDAWNAITDPEPMGFRERAWGAAWQLLEPFAAEDMVMQGVYDVKRNKKASGGEVWNPEDTPRNILTAASDHLWKKFEPGFITSGRRLSKAWSGYSEQSGRVYSRTGEIISFLAGVRSNSVDIEGSLRYKSWKFRDRKRDANKLTTRHGYSMKTGSSDDFRKALEQTERQLQDIYSQMHQDLQAGIKLELLTEGESYRILKLNNISDADARLVLANRHVSHRLSNDQLRKIYKTTEGEKKLEYYRKWQQGLRE